MSAETITCQQTGLCQPGLRTVASDSGTRVTRASNAFGQIATIARKEFSDRFRSGWVIACALVWLGAIAFTSIFGLVQIGRIGVQGYERTAMSLLNLVQYLVPLLGLLIGHDRSEEHTSEL